MKKSDIASILMILGTLVVMASIVLPLFGSSSLTGQWTEEQAQEHSMAGATMHALAHERLAAKNPEAHKLEKGGHSGTEDHADAVQKFDAAEKVFQEGKQKLDSAQSLPERIAFWLRMLGGGVLVVGLAIYFQDRRHAS
jgi:hypothetical protein